MALDRTNMVSLLDIGTLMGGKTPKIAELGDGFKEITESWGPDMGSTQYVNMKAKANTLKGYDFSTTVEREYISDEVQTTVDKLFKTLPTGKQCETYYYRFYKSDLSTSGSSMTGECIRIPVTVAPDSTGGSGGDILTSSVQIKGNGDAVLGTITISEDGAFTWAAS